MTKTTAYRTLYASTSEELDENINHYLGEGWDVYGCQHVHEGNFHQPMIKRTEIGTRTFAKPIPVIGDPAKEIKNLFQP